MNISLYHHGKLKGTILSSALPAFQILSEQLGFQSELKDNGKKLLLHSYLKNKKVILKVNNHYTQFNSMLKSCLSYTGLQVVDFQAGSKTLNHEDLIIDFQCTNRLKRSTDLQLTITHNNLLTNKEVNHYFLHEFQDFDIRVEIEQNNDEPIPYLHVCYTETENEENIALRLANGVIRYLLKGNETAIISCMSLDLLNNLLSAPPQKRKRKLEKSAENTASRKLEQAKMLQAEVIFDYTVMPNSNFDHFIIIGNLLIKNIGNTALKNPFICLRINPSDKVELGGQILPPEMTEILAVQGTGGAQGWQYVGEDWLTKAFETGEYWIRPINDVRIMPKETEALRQFQLSIDKLQEKGTITVEGFVYFQEQNLRFPASNRIVFSF